MENPFFAMLESVNTDQASIGNMQITDANATDIDVNIEQNVYKACNSVLGHAATALENYISSNSGNVTSTVQAKIDSLQAIYQEDSSVTQTNESTSDNAVQAAQTQAGQDGTNLSNKVQLAQTLISVTSTIAGLLGHAY